MNKREARGKAWVYLYLQYAFLRWSLDSDPNPNLKLEHAGHSYSSTAARSCLQDQRKKMSSWDYKEQIRSIKRCIDSERQAQLKLG